MPESEMLASTPTRTVRGGSSGRGRVACGAVAGAVVAGAAATAGAALVAAAAGASPVAAARGLAGGWVAGDGAAAGAQAASPHSATAIPSRRAEGWTSRMDAPPQGPPSDALALPSAPTRDAAPRARGCGHHGRR